MATEEAATMARKMGRVRPQRKETCSIAIPCQHPVRLWRPSGRRIDLHGSSRSARRFMSGPSPGFGAGVIHLFCCLPAVCLPLSADASLRLIMRDSIVPSVAAGEGRNGRGWDDVRVGCSQQSRTKFCRVPSLREAGQQQPTSSSQHWHWNHHTASVTHQPHPEQR